ncbi:MAG: hypothetical protein ACMG57_02745 [Candidatus Dojkabacteria bacterium]
MTDYLQGHDAIPPLKQQIENRLNNLDYSITELLSAVDNFPADKREKVLFIEWSLKDLLAHFSGWNLITIEDLKLLKQGRTNEIKPWFPDEEIDDFNAKHVNTRKDLLWEVVYSEFLKTLNDLYLEYRNLTTQWESQLGPNPTTPFESIKVDIEHIGKTHLADIQKIAEE